MEPDMRRMERDVEDLLRRVRTIEDASSPYAQQLLGEFRELQKRVTEFSEQGTPHSRRELRYVERQMEEVRDEMRSKADDRDLQELREEQRSNRTMVRSALIAASLALATGIILFIIERATGR